MSNIYKRFLFTVCCVLLIHIGSAYAQQGQGPMDDVVNAVRYGRVPDISKYLDNIIPITINNNQSIYSHAQADMVLKDFFSKNTPSDFIVGNSGPSGNNATFVVGELITAAGKYNVYILLKSAGSNYILQELRFNKE
jgi:hypothetical protein